MRAARPVRRTRHRRRFHTDRIVAARRARHGRETPPWPPELRAADHGAWLARALSHGRLASTDPWDCGRASCGVCRSPEPGRRRRDERSWRADWEL